MKNVIYALFVVAFSIALAACGGSSSGQGETTATSVTVGKITPKTTVNGDLLVTDVPETMVVTVNGVSKEVEDFNDDGSFAVEYKQGQKIELHATYWAQHRTGSNTTPAIVTLTGQTVATSGSQQTVDSDMTNVEDLPEEDVDIQESTIREACLAGNCSGLPVQTVPAAEWNEVNRVALAGRSDNPLDATWSSDEDGILDLNLLRVPARYFDVQGIAKVKLPAGKYRWWPTAINQGETTAIVNYETMEDQIWTVPLSQIVTEIIPVGWQKNRAVEFTLNKETIVQLTVSIGKSDPGTKVSFGQVVIEQLAGQVGKELSKTVGKAEQTSTGFYWPLGTSNYRESGGGWLERDKNNGGKYPVYGVYHVGVDMMASVTAPVYPIADGTIVMIDNGAKSWGPGNSGIFVEHKTKKKKFVALYAHVRTNLKPGDKVTGGTAMAAIGPYSGGNHVHFGVLKDTKIPKTGWGRMPNSSWKNTNNFVDPVAFIKNEKPK